MANEGGSQKSKVVAALIVGMILGVASAGLVAWFVVEKNPASFGDGGQRELPKTVPPVVQPPVAAPAPAAASAVGAPPQYEFYRVLPDKSEGGAARKPAIAAKPPVNQQPAKAVDSTSYFVQAGSFQNADDAEKLKAKLALTGMEASVQKADVPGKGVWYRVRLGPYKGQAEANSTIASLKENGIGNATAVHAQ
jgi:cell division protein FtsN